MASRREMASPAYDWEDFVALDEDDLRELIDGELVEVEVPGLAHEWVVGGLVVALRVWAGASGAIVLPSGYKVRIRADRGVMPDVQVFRTREHAVLLERGLEQGRPDLVVEVVSPSSRRFDRVVKLRWYADLGVPEYWLVDPDARTLECLVLEGASYRIAEALEGDATFAPASCPGLAIELPTLWSMPGDR